VLHQIWKFSICGVMLFAVGCYAGSYAGYEANKAAGGGTDAAMGEQHDVPYSAHDAFLLTEDALRGEGVLFDPEPDDKLVTLWRDADTKAGVFGDLVGVHPQYRYEISVVPQGSRRARIIVNVRAQDIADDDLPKYKATTRLNLFHKVDQLAAKFPPSGGTPNEGGVNYAVLPHEDLKALARRATGNEGNWQTIAEDNGLKSPTDAAGTPSVWIRNSLLTKPKKGASTND
jgi:hypothetical protein